jgi:hypothetical protein
MDIPGTAVGMYRIAPSFKGGINSEPNLKKMGTVATVISKARIMTVLRNLTTKSTTGE